MLTECPAIVGAAEAAVVIDLLRYGSEHRQAAFRTEGKDRTDRILRKPAAPRIVYRWPGPTMSQGPQGNTVWPSAVLNRDAPWQACTHLSVPGDHDVPIPPPPSR